MRYFQVIVQVQIQNFDKKPQPLVKILDQVESCYITIRVPTRPGKPGKMRVHLENLEISRNQMKNLINIMEK